MPATYTHHLFSEDVFKVVNEKTQLRIKDEIEIYKLFAKSFDIFYFTKSNLGYLGHHKNINEYFKNIILFMRNNNLTDNSQILAYLYGSICHYVLDTTCHPFVFYKTGRYNIKDKSTYKYKGKTMDEKFYLFNIKNNCIVDKIEISKEEYLKI